VQSLIDHVHTYVFWKVFGGERTFKCAHPDCEETRVQSWLVGKRGTCSKCGTKDIIYTPDDLRRARPLCSDCSNTKENRERRKIKDLLNGLPDFAALKDKDDERTPQ
jgi:hypothetical protein